MKRCTPSGVTMEHRHVAIRDPRTVARDIPGISDILFPQLTAGLVAQLNKNIRPCAGVQRVPIESVCASTLQRAMLFEVAFARGQQILNGKENPDWDDCLKVASIRQRQHFDAAVPESLVGADMEVAEHVARNLADMLSEIRIARPGMELIHSPSITGYQWISSSQGDFAVGTQLIEVKCTNRPFGVRDYRQVLMYWLLSYAAAIERDCTEWTSCILLNPRLNHVVEITFCEIIGFITAGKSKVEILELFSSVVGDYGLRAIADINL